VFDVARALVDAYTRTGRWGDSGAPLIDPTSDVTGGTDGDLANQGFLVASAPVGVARTLQRPKRFHQSERTAVAHLMSYVSHVLTSSQFLRAATCLSRDAIGALSIGDLERTLNHWIQDYVDESGSSGDAGGPPARPLTEARIRLHNVLGSPGEIEVVLEMRSSVPGAARAPLTRHAMRTVSPVLF
jgi:predicted component of type VI protein secretion system